MDWRTLQDELDQLGRKRKELQQEVESLERAVSREQDDADRLRRSILVRLLLKLKGTLPEAERKELMDLRIARELLDGARHDLKVVEERIKDLRRELRRAKQRRPRTLTLQEAETSLRRAERLARRAREATSQADREQLCDRIHEELRIANAVFALSPRLRRCRLSHNLIVATPRKLEMAEKAIRRAREALRDILRTLEI